WLHGAPVGADAVALPAQEATLSAPISLAVLSAGLEGTQAGGDGHLDGDLPHDLARPATDPSASSPESPGNSTPAHTSGQKGAIALPDALAPRTAIRPSRHGDDEGGPGDTPASVAWLREGRGTGYAADV